MRRARTATRRVKCPICMDVWAWPEDDLVHLYDEPARRYRLVDLGRLRSQPDKYADHVERAYHRCPNPSRDTPEHYLPATYIRYRDPLVIGMVGLGEAGKTHLLTAMIRAAYLDGLRPYGLSVSALDERRHATFRAEHITPFEQGRRLDATSRNVSVYSDALLVAGSGTLRPLIFFDVAGEDLLRTDVRGRGGRFLLGAHALIFVHEPEDGRSDGPGGRRENPAFARALSRVGTRADAAKIPVAVAVTKSDRVRFVPPVDRWLGRSDAEPLDAARTRAETRDVYAYLHSVGDVAALAPWEAFERATLHFVSASGGDVSDGEGVFPRGIRPARVLQPLLAILAMTGVISGPQAAEVGRP